MKKNFFGKKWFFEGFLDHESKTSIWGFEIGKEIFSGKSKFQKIEILETKEYGKVLILDDLIQLSTKYEFVYHEMLVHPAMLCSSKIEKILIVGGGDGGVLREVVKYLPVKEIVLVDIDKKVIDLSKKYLPSVSNNAFNDKRLKILNIDAFNFVKQYKNHFDVIFNDLSEPTGPSVLLWKNKFYKDIFNAVKDEGVAAFQSEYLEEKFGLKMRKELGWIFPFLKTHKAFVGCFPFGEYTFSFGSKKIDFNKMDFKKISQKFKKEKIKTKYYSPEAHFVSQFLNYQNVNHQ